MSSTRQSAVIALDLGTTSFKCGLVTPDGALLAPPLVENYDLNYADGGVTCAPELYARLALNVLAGVAAQARETQAQVTGVGISSQAQTWLPLAADGTPLADAVVWTDDRAKAEAAELKRALPDFAATGGFTDPSPLQFLPKLLQWRRQEPAAAAKVWKHLLLNEYIVYRLTGATYGDSSNAGMGGLLDIRTGKPLPAALAAAGLTAAHVAETARPAVLARPLTPEVAASTGLPAVPVYSCGNDQSCGAAGAGLEQEGDVLCNFGTAMVIYSLTDKPVADITPQQIAGIASLPGKYFLLGVESECGNLMAWAHDLFFAGRSYEEMFTAALACDPNTTPVPSIRPAGSGRVDILNASPGTAAPAMVRGFLEYFSDRFTDLFHGLLQGRQPRRVFASGGLSRSQAWLEFMGRRAGVALQRTDGEHATLAGVARIIRAAHQVQR